MLERFNYFDKTKILRADVRIKLLPPSPDGRHVSVALSIADLDLPAQATVFVEAYRQMEYERAPLGTVLECAEARSATFTELPDLDGMLFRIRVVNTETHVVLAEAEGLRADAGPEAVEQDSILPVRAASIGDRVWQMALEEPPTILINEKFADWRGVAKSAAFRASVFPHACEAALEWAAGQVDDAPDPNSSAGQWLRFGEILTGQVCPIDADRHSEWASEAAAAFARREGSFDRFDSAVRGEERS